MRAPVRISIIAIAACVIGNVPPSWRAHADTEVEVPVLILETEEQGAEGESTTDLDLANLVEAAAKGRTTVQEAPAIVTVITADEIRERGLTNLEQIIDTVPGWLRLGGLHNQFPYALTRGTFQGTLFLYDGLSLFEPLFNAPTFGRIQPVETIKRIELVTGPGGVLWGANSYMGIVNVITKDAEDVDGVEAGLRFGDGNGDRDLARGYVMAGLPSLGGTDASLLLHTSFETYIGPGFEMPALQLHNPLPQPNGPVFYGPLTQAQPRRSLLFNLNGKLELGSAKLTFALPWARSEKPLGFPGSVIRYELPEDELIGPDGEPLCQPEEPLEDPMDSCADKGRRARENRPDFFDRYISVDIRKRMLDGRAGISAKAYAVQFIRSFTLNAAPAAIGLLEGGLSFRFEPTIYRTGANLDGDLELGSAWRLLYGVEAFREWLPDNTERSRQGAGVETTALGPYDLSKLPLPCPREPDGMGGVRPVAGCPLTFAFAADRAVAAAYLNPQWRPFKRLILDGGVRVQAAPASLSSQPYDTQLLLSGALVYNLVPGWYVKLNYTQGARPPVFSNTNSNGEAIQIAGDPDLDVETSQALQTELNARIFKGKRRLRELAFRVDYSYTKLSNLIQIVSGKYSGEGNRGIHAAELLSKLYVQGGHWMELSYSFLRIDLDDRGPHRSMPEHWFNLGGYFSLSSKGSLAATVNLRVLGAMEDPNRLVEHRNFRYGDGGVVVNNMGVPQYQIVQPHELVMDRLPPGADLTVGLMYTGISGLRLAAMAYNAFNARYYQPDGFFDYEPRLEFLPNPYEDFRFVVDAVYSY